MAKDENLDVFKNAPEETATVAATGRKLRIGFIGTGGIANSHMKAYKQFNDVEIVAGADLIEGKAADFFAKYDLPDVKCYTDYKQMIAENELDAVSMLESKTGVAVPKPLAGIADRTVRFDPDDAIAAEAMPDSVLAYQRF